MDEILKQGDLVKSPPTERNILGRLKHWRRRFFVLTSSRLSYYESQKAYNRGDKFLGFVDISECIDVALAPDSLRTNEFIVVLRTKEKGQHKGRVFELSAENQITQKDWFNVLDKCIKQPVELSDDEDTPQAGNGPSVYLPSSPTTLEKSIEEAKSRSSMGEARISGDRGSFPSREVYDEEGRDIKTDNEACDEVFEKPKFETGGEVEKGPNDNRNSHRSSGYASDVRYSASSRSSEFSDIWGNENGQNLIEFSAEFEGPRCTTSIKASIKAKSMGNLLEISSNSNRNRMITSEARRPSLQEQIDMLLSLSDRRKEASMSQSFEEPLYENIPHLKVDGVDDPTSCRCVRQRNRDFSSVPRRPRPSSDPLEPSSERNEAGIKRNQSCGSSYFSNFKNDDSTERSRLSEKNPNCTAEQRLPTRPPKCQLMAHRQCSKIEENPEEVIQHRSNSDPTALRQKKLAAASPVYV